MSAHHKPVKIAVLGARGRMGCALLEQIDAHPQARLCAGLVAKGSNVDGQVENGVQYTSDLRAALNVCDVLIDFSHPKAAIDAALLMYKTKCQTLVTGTTGYSDTEDRALCAAADAITLVKSGNFSIGICVLEALVKQAARALPKNWDADILDIHHRFKRDAPSGTALMLGQALKDGGQHIEPNEYASLRHGGIIGEHSVYLGDSMETITLKHTALDRAVFAKGALTAALWAIEQDKGLFDMRDVLGV